MTARDAQPSPFHARPEDGRESSLSRLWRWLAPYRVRLATAMFAAMVSAAAGMMPPVVIGRVIIDHVLRGDAGSGPDFGQWALTLWITAVTGLHPIAAACGLAAFWIALSALGSFIFLTQFARASQFGLARLRTALFAHVERLPPAFFDRSSVGQIISRIANDVEALGELFIGLGSLAGVAIPFAVAASIMLALDSTLMLQLFPILPIAALANYAFRKSVKSVYPAARASLSRLAEYLHENLAGIEEVQACGREGLNLARYSAIAREAGQSEARAARLETTYFPFVENLSYLALGLILWFGGRRVLQTEASLGSVVLFIQFSDMLVRPVIALGDQATNVLRARAASTRIFRLLDWREALREPTRPIALPRDLRGKIEFRGLSFGYHEGEEVLRRINLTVKPGESLAIVGPTGSGKSTLTKLICRFYDVPDGSLFIDDVDVMHVSLSDIRKRVGVIFQDFHIFSGTVYDNIALGDANITREKAVAAARVVDALSFIEALPCGLDTELGDRGRNLSYGQRQLLAFARAIARDPEILILDEATASVDAQTEAIIQLAMEEIKRGRTSIVVAHRLRTIRDATHIIVMDRGQIIEAGTHEELMTKDGLYKTLHDLQS